MPSSAASRTPPDEPKTPTGAPAEFNHFIHLAHHALQVERNEKPGLLLMDCWFFDGGVPAWADELAQAGAPPSTWCPWVNPTLTDRSDGAVTGR